MTSPKGVSKAPIKSEIAVVYFAFFIISITELNQRLDEDLSDIKAGRVIPAEAVNKRLNKKYGI